MCPNMNSPAFEPSDEQKKIIETDEDTIVISNPGTGKTTTLALKAISLLEKGVKPEDILCVTFTEKAKREMYEAIRDLNKNYAKVKKPDSEIMKIEIHTFHSLCFNYLADVGLVSGDLVPNNILRFSVLTSFLSNNVLQYPKSYIIGEIVPKVENAIRYIKNFGILPDKIDVSKAQKQLSELRHGEPLHDEDKSVYTLNEMKAFMEYFVATYKAYEDSKTEGDIDYSDMLLMFREKFQGRKFPHVLVDEMQDMNGIQAEIVDMVRENLFLVGDAKQAIFGFQGGSIKNFETFAQKCKSMLLSANRRSTQEILDYSKEYFLGGTRNRTKFENELQNFKSSTNGSKPKIFSTAAPLAQILELIEENQGKKIGIITRTNKQNVIISRYLDDNSIEYTSTSSQATSHDARLGIANYIKGLLSDRMEDKIAAAFTPFSPFTIKEAFELAKAYKEKNAVGLEKLKIQAVDLTRENLEKEFSKVIYPKCVSNGPEWLTTAALIHKQINEYLTFQTPILDELFDFLAIGEEAYTDRSKQADITLSTVHKAKGRAFDVVIYLPRDSDPKSSFIDTITSAILASQGMDLDLLEEELTEESLRVDFVAFTRAREKLFVIAKSTFANRFYIDNLSESEVGSTENDEQQGHVENKLYRDAYKLFVSNRFEESKKLLAGEKPWLKDYIFYYFENIDHFSWSSVKTDPWIVMKNNIMNFPFYNTSTDFGSEVHRALEDIIHGKAKPEDFTGDVQRALENAMLAWEDLKSKYPGLEVVDTELDVDVPLNSVTNSEYPDLLMTGKIDVLFKHDSGYIIGDWKTDYAEKRASDHKRQLSVYKKMYSKLENVPEDQITTCVIFIALRETVNTGKFGWKVDIGRKLSPFPTFEGHLQKILGWKKDPEKFIETLLAHQEFQIYDDEDKLLFRAMKEQLEKES